MPSPLRYTMPTRKLLRRSVFRDRPIGWVPRSSRRPPSRPSPRPTPSAGALAGASADEDKLRELIRALQRREVSNAGGDVQSHVAEVMLQAIGPLPWEQRIML